jgi:hypothetical protein
MERSCQGLGGDIRIHFPDPPRLHDPWDIPGSLPEEADGAQLFPVLGSHNLGLVFQKGLDLLQKQDPPGVFQYAQGRFLRHGPDGAHPEESHFLFHTQTFYRLHGIGLTHTGCENGEDRLFWACVTVEDTRFKILPDGLEPFVGAGMESGRGDESVQSGKMRLTADGFKGTQGHVAPGVADARHQSDHDRKSRFLREIEGPDQHIPAVFRRGGLQKRDVGRRGQVAGVLFLYTGMGTGVVRNDQDQSPEDAGQGECGQKIHGHVESVGFHHRNGPQSREGGRGRHLQGHFLVDGPFGVNPPFPGDRGQGLEDLNRRRSGIGGRHLDPRFKGAPCRSLISRKHARFSGRVQIPDEFGHNPIPFMPFMETVLQCIRLIRKKQSNRRAL